MMNLDSDIIVALITGALTLVGVIVNSHAIHKHTIEETRAIQEKTLQAMEYRIGSLEKEVNKHNNVIERVYALEQDDKIHDEQIKVANHRIDDLEEEQKHQTHQKS